jgi:hypothetical protein
MYTFILNSKITVTVYYTGKHVSRVFEDLRKMKAPTNHTIDQELQSRKLIHL